MTPKIQFADGVPRLLIDGQAVPPILFFFNTDVDSGRFQAVQREQIRLASRSGVHLYSFPLRCPRKSDGVEPDYAWGEKLFDSFIENDPRALFIVRVYPGPWPFWREWKEIPPAHIVRYADGASSGNISLASDYFWEPANEDLAKLIRHFEGSPYGPRILAYNPGGPEHEMFMDGYREKGPDYSAVNQERFRRWLTARYRTDESLRRAWDDVGASLRTAGVPTFQAGRFPMHGTGGGSIFYDLPREQDWVDFSQYCSDLAADRIIDWARLVKRETSGRKLAAFFYGYTLDLPGSFSGHYALQRVLACPEVDILVSPCAYRDRRPGGAGGFMAPVDSVAAHGKLWINEDDTRTHLWGLHDEKPPAGRAWLGSREFNLEIAARDLGETRAMLDRNLASILVHRAGIWWTDLSAVGAFNDPSLWQWLEKGMALYERVYRFPKPYRPQVAVLVDERSKLHVKSDWDAQCWTMFQMRDESAKAGASVGYYELQDFLDGLVPPCRAYVFANAFFLTDGQIRGLRSRLDRERATAIWIYAPGYLGPGGPDVARASLVTGMTLGVKDGPQVSRGMGFLEGKTWGTPDSLSPRLIVADGSVEPLGRYGSDGEVSAAQIRTGEHRSIFIGDISISAEVFARLFESAGAHIWTRGKAVVQTDGETLMVHSSVAPEPPAPSSAARPGVSGFLRRLFGMRIADEPGVVRIWLPAGVDAVPLHGETVRREGGVLLARLAPGTTSWFALRPHGP